MRPFFAAFADELMKVADVPFAMRAPALGRPRGPGGMGGAMPSPPSGPPPLTGKALSDRQDAESNELAPRSPQPLSGKALAARQDAESNVLAPRSPQGPKLDLAFSPIDFKQ